MVLQEESRPILLLLLLLLLFLPSSKIVASVGGRSEVLNQGA
jgi:hypothetical protein